VLVDSFCAESDLIPFVCQYCEKFVSKTFCAFFICVKRMKVKMKKDNILIIIALNCFLIMRKLRLKTYYHIKL